MNDREKWKEHSDADGGVLVPRLHLDAHFSQVGGDDRAELAAEEAVDEGVDGRVAVADPQDNAAEGETEKEYKGTQLLADPCT